jgi:hypothetical protein
MRRKMVRLVGRFCGWGLLLATGGCPGESPVVGANDAEPAGGSGSQLADVSGTLTRYLTPIIDGAGRCLPTELPIEEDGTASCKIFTTSVSAGCTCDGPNRAPVSASQRDAVQRLAKQYEYCDGAETPVCLDLCVCENLEAVGDALTACTADLETTADGWCYVAPAQGIGSPEAVAACPNDALQRIRFMNGAQLGMDRAYLACSGAPPVQSPRAPLGSVCVPTDEADPSFSGFQFEDVTIDVGTQACESGVCVVEQFQGRVSCPLGSPGPDNGGSAGECRTPDSHRAVTVKVLAQLVNRPPSLGSTCSCRCAGPGDGPFCDCGANLECVPLIDALGLGNDDAYAGSYCVPRGAVPGPPRNIDTCVDDPQACRKDRPF